MTATLPDDVVTVRSERGLVRATLNRPDAGNALRPDLLRGVDRALDLAEQDPACRALVLDSSSSRFCLGMDLDGATASRWRDSAAGATFRAVLARLRDTPVVTVAVVDGPAVGGGVGLAGACDLVVAGDAATFRLTEVFFGLLPGMMLPYLAHRVGEQAAYRMALLATEVSAAEAARLGLADLRAPRAADGLRQVFVGLSRTDRETLRELKVLRRRLFPAETAGYGEHAQRLLGERLADPSVRARIARLRSEVSA